MLRLATTTERLWGGAAPSPALLYDKGYAEHPKAESRQETAWVHAGLHDSPFLPLVRI